MPGAQQGTPLSLRTGAVVGKRLRNLAVSDVRARGRADHGPNPAPLSERDPWSGQMVARLVGADRWAGCMHPDPRPFATAPDRWQTHQARALRNGHPLSASCSRRCKPVLVKEDARWGWRTWTVPSDGSLPEIPHQIGVIAPGTGRIYRSVLCWMATRIGRRVTMAPTMPALRRSTLCAAIISLLGGLLAIRAGIAVDVALPALALIPLLTDRLEDALEIADAVHIRRIDGEAACRYVRRLGALQDQLVVLDTHGRRYELRRAADIGHGLLWDTAGLLQLQDTRAASAALITRETLMLRLVDQASKCSRWSTVER